MNTTSDLIERHGLNAPSIALLENRTVSIWGPIDDLAARRAIENILYLDYENPSKPITLQIFSPGGSVAAGLAILDACRNAKSSVNTIGIGTCASMAAVLLVCAGDKGSRYVTEHADLMLHQPRSSMSGDATSIETTAKKILRTKDVLEGLIANASGMTREEARRLCDRDTWLEPEEAIALGLIDHIVGKKRK